jgi:hypothetical protein
VGGGRYLESVKEAECSGNTMCSCMKMKKWDMLKLFQEWGKGKIKENNGGGDPNYNIL